MASGAAVNPASARFAQYSVRPFLDGSNPSTRPLSERRGVLDPLQAVPRGNCDGGGPTPIARAEPLLVRAIQGDGAIVGLHPELAELQGRRGLVEQVDVRAADGCHDRECWMSSARFPVRPQRAW